MSKTTDGKKIKTLLERGVAQVIDRDVLERMLTSGKKLRVKLGIDPTAPDLHLGHAVVLRKLKEFQDLGHKVVLIVGDFTAQIGDPSGKSKTRPPLSEADIKKNMKNFLAQAGKVIDVKKAEVRKNSEWLAKLQGPKLMELLSSVSVQQIIERNDFAERFAAHKPVRMHELLYPILQGYDSVMIKADVEIGGNDQLFNLLVGRTLMDRYAMEPQQILTTPLLVGLDGVHKMSKSLGNYIGLTDAPNDMFGKVMSIQDAHMKEYFELCAGVSADEFISLQNHLSPRDLKAHLASEIVKLYHGAGAAEKAEENFTKVFSKKDFTAEIVSSIAPSSGTTAVLLARESGVAKSNADAWRLAEQGGVRVNDVAKTNPREKFPLVPGDVVQVGKKHFSRVKR